MNSRTDQELLRSYAENGSETAFSEVVRRHADFVCSVALRLVRGQQLAEDVSQGVFLALAGNAARLADREVLAGWLHRTAHNLSANAVRADARHHARERKAAAMNDLLTSEIDANWESIAPHLDSALSQLKGPDRDALLLRYFQRMSANEMARVLGISGEAAQKRVNRRKETNLTQAQMASYLAANERNASSLLAAYRTTRDPALLWEAAQKYSSDPQAAFETAMQSGLSTVDRRSWLDAFKRAAPDNALANYLSALDYFKAGQTAEAVQEVNVAVGKDQFQDYSQARIQADEAAYLAAGYAPSEAKMMAKAFLTEAELPGIKELAQNLIGLAAAYQQSGDQTSHDTAVQIAVNLGRRLDDPSGSESILHQLVGLGMETAALSGLDPTSPYDTAGQTVQNRLDELAEQKASLQMLTAQPDPLCQTLSDQDWVNFHTRLAASGEEKALRWLVGNCGGPVTPQYSGFSTL